MIVSYRNGNPVHLSEIAHVYDGLENDKGAAWFPRAAETLRVDQGFQVFFASIFIKTRKMLDFRIFLLTFALRISNLPSYSGHYVLFPTVL